jgi:hypothetical protein
MTLKLPLDEMTHKYFAGARIADLVAAYGYSHCTIYAHLRRAGRHGFLKLLY